MQATAGLFARATQAVAEPELHRRRRWRPGPATQATAADEQFVHRQLLRRHRPTGRRGAYIKAIDR